MCCVLVCFGACLLLQKLQVLPVAVDTVPRKGSNMDRSLLTSHDLINQQKNYNILSDPSKYILRYGDWRHCYGLEGR